MRRATRVKRRRLSPLVADASASYEKATAPEVVVGGARIHSGVVSSAAGATRGNAHSSLFHSSCSIPNVHRSTSDDNAITMLSSPTVHSVTVYEITPDNVNNLIPVGTAPTARSEMHDSRPRDLETALDAMNSFNSSDITEQTSSLALK